MWQKHSPMTTNQKFREAAETLQLWVNQLKAENDLCISEILDAVEPPGGNADAETRSQASWSTDRIAKRIIDVMSAYDSMLETLGEPKLFNRFINQLMEPDGNEGQ